jgi:hypothetical protein
MEEKTFEHQPTQSPKSKKAKVSPSFWWSWWQWQSDSELTNTKHNHTSYSVHGNEQKNLAQEVNLSEEGNSNNQEPQGEDNQYGRKIGLVTNDLS